MLTLWKLTSIKTCRAMDVMFFFLSNNWETFRTQKYDLLTDWPCQSYENSKLPPLNVVFIDYRIVVNITDKVCCDTMVTPWQEGRITIVYSISRYTEKLIIQHMRCKGFKSSHTDHMFYFVNMALHLGHYTAATPLLHYYYTTTGPW